MPQISILGFTPTSSTHAMFETLPLTLVNSALILGIILVLIIWPAVKEKTKELKEETQRMRDAAVGDTSAHKTDA